jgi:cytochrome c peroxidase
MKSIKFYGAAALTFAALAIVSCKPEKPENPATRSAEVPLLPESPDDYPVSQNDDLATLGRVLFYDKELSLNNNIACGTCHKQENSFCDNMQTSPGTDGHRGNRNTPTVFPKEGRMFWDGRSQSLNDMVLRPISEPVEMNQSIANVVRKVQKLDYYKHLFKKAFPNASEPDSNHIRLAIAEFIRNFNFTNTKFARSTRGDGSLSTIEQQGEDLFMGKAKCGECHHVQPDGFNPHNTGYGRTNESHNIGLDEFPSDAGVGAISKNPQEQGAFMMPVLLNVEHTAPYMHDGRFKTLEEVVDHYNSKIKNAQNLDHILRGFDGKPIKLNLTDNEKKALVAFLKTLTDPGIMTDGKYSDPFIQRIN